MLTTHYFVSRRVMSHESTNRLFLGFFFGPAAAAVAQLKGSALPFKTAPPARHISKVALRTTPIMHLFMV